MARGPRRLRRADDDGARKRVLGELLPADQMAATCLFLDAVNRLPDAPEAPMPQLLTGWERQGWRQGRKEGREEGRQEGRQEGEVAGMRAPLIRQLAIRGIPLDGATEVRIGERDRGALLALTDAIFGLRDWADLDARLARTARG